MLCTATLSVVTTPHNVETPRLLTRQQFSLLSKLSAFLIAKLWWNLDVSLHRAGQIQRRYEKFSISQILISALLYLGMMHASHTHVWYTRYCSFSYPTYILRWGCYRCNSVTPIQFRKPDGKKVWRYTGPIVSTQHRRWQTERQTDRETKFTHQYCAQ